MVRSFRHSPALPQQSEKERQSETHLYRIAQGALNNSAKYAEASEVVLTLERTADEVILVVTDDGKGFNVNGHSTLESGRGLGLVGMAERADLIGAKLSIDSAPGIGTNIVVKVPTLSSNDPERF